MHSRVEQRGSLRLTISRPSAEMVVTLRYRLTSLTFVVFLEGRVPKGKMGMSSAQVRTLRLQGEPGSSAGEWRFDTSGKDIVS